SGGRGGRGRWRRSCPRRRLASSSVLSPPPRGVRLRPASPCHSVQVRLALAESVERSADGPVLAPCDEQFLGGELRDHLATVGCDPDLPFDPPGPPALGGRPVCL